MENVNSFLESRSLLSLDPTIENIRIGDSITLATVQELNTVFCSFDASPAKTYSDMYLPTLIPLEIRKLIGVRLIITSIGRRVPMSFARFQRSIREKYQNNLGYQLIQAKVDTRENFTAAQRIQLNAILLNYDLDTAMFKRTRQVMELPSNISNQMLVFNDIKDLL